MLSESSASQAISILFHTSATLQRITELLNSPDLKIRLRALIELIILPLDNTNERVDKENRRQLLKDYQNRLDKKTTEGDPFDKLVDELQDPNIFISAMTSHTQQLSTTQIFATEHNLPNPRYLSGESYLVEHQLLAYALLYFNDISRGYSELLSILSAQNSTNFFSHFKLIHLILLKRRGLLQEEDTLLEIINAEIRFIDDNLLVLERGGSLSPQTQALIINKFELFACFDEFKYLLRTNWMSRLIGLLKSLFELEQWFQNNDAPTTEDKQLVLNKIIAFYCIRPLLQSLSQNEIEQFILPFWLSLLSMEQKEYESETQTYDPKTIRYFYALQLFLFEILPVISTQEIDRVINFFFDRFTEVDACDFKHHVGVTCMVLLPYCDRRSISDSQLKILVAHLWDLLHISKQQKEMNLTGIKYAIIYRVFSILVKQNKMILLMPYFYQILDEEDQSSFFGEITKVWLGIALDSFSPELIAVFFQPNNIERLVKILLSTIYSDWLYTPYEELKLLHKLIYMLPPELLASSTFDTIWVNVYNDMCDEPNTDYKIYYLAILLTLGMRLPVEKLIKYFFQDHNNLINFVVSCYDIVSHNNECINAMTMVFDTIIQRLVTLNNPHMQSFIHTVCIERFASLARSTEKQSCDLWIIARLLPHCSSQTKAEDAVIYFSKISMQISMDDPTIPEEFLKNFAIFSVHLPRMNVMQLLPYAMLAIGQLLNANILVDDIFPPIDSLILLYSCSAIPEFSPTLLKLIMMGLTAIISGIDSSEATQQSNNVTLRENALRNIVDILSSCNSPEHICEYLFPILPALIQSYPRYFEKISRGITFVRECTTRQIVKVSDQFSNIIENPFVKIILSLNQSPRHLEAFIQALCKCIRPNGSSNVNIYLLASLLLGEHHSNDYLQQFQQHLTPEEKLMARLLKDSEWVNRTPPVMSDTSGMQQLQRSSLSS